MDAMDRLACHVIYVNREVGEDRLIQAAPGESSSQFSPDRKHDGLRETVQPLLDAFGDGTLHYLAQPGGAQIPLHRGLLTMRVRLLVHVCATANSCLSKLFELQDDSMMDMTPTLVLLDTPHDQQLQEPRTLSHSSINGPDSSSLTGTAEIHRPDEELYGLTLLQKIITEAHLRSMSKLIVPIPLISYPNSVASAPGEQMTDGAVETVAADAGSLAFHRQLIRRCLDLGAVDVIVSPLSAKCVTSLEICAYKAHRDAAREQQAQMEIAKGRKRSWVGVNEQKPFAYLREAMVSGLMNGICRMDEESQQIAGAHIAVSAERQADIAVAVGEWHFCAHSFSDDELLVAALVMFKHALTVSDLERWQISTGKKIWAGQSKTCIVC